MIIDLDNLEYKELLLSNGNTQYFIVANGICYQYSMKYADGTYKERDKSDMIRVIVACEYARIQRERIRLWYGNVDTGRSWDDEYNVTGYIARSFGKYPIPILANNARSLGGGAILTDRIIRLDSTKTGKTLYKHPKFYVGSMEIVDEQDPELRNEGRLISVRTESLGCIARFETRKKADNWIKFMNGERYCK